MRYTTYNEWFYEKYDYLHPVERVTKFIETWISWLDKAKELRPLLVDIDWLLDIYFDN